jgi:hypothetical protein
VFGKWNTKDGIAYLEGGNEGRLVVKSTGGKLEVLNNEGGQIMREKKFILFKTALSPPENLVFLAKAKLHLLDDQNVNLRFCNSDILWDVVNGKAELMQKSQPEIGNPNEPVLLLLSFETIKNNSNAIKYGIKIHDIKKQIAPVSCQ